MIIRYLSDKNKLQFDGLVVKATNIIRNEINGWRKKSQVVETMGGSHVPYMPRPFPGGIWAVQRPEKRDDPDTWPYFIPTTAARAVFTWERDNDGYKQESELVVMDEGYGIHHAKNSTTTLGCIEVVDVDDLLLLVNAINDAMDQGQRIFLEVV